VVGEQKYLKTMREFSPQVRGQVRNPPPTFRPSRRKLRTEADHWFFSQWLDSTGAPEFKNQVHVYRLGNNKGFPRGGQIDQDLDLFRMPVDLKIDTDGKTEQKRIEVVARIRHSQSRLSDVRGVLAVDPQPCAHELQGDQAAVFDPARTGIDSAEEIWQAP